MPITHEPNPLPSPLDYVPAQSTTYQVKSTDSWWTLAELPQVRGVGLSALDLCYSISRRGSHLKSTGISETRSGAKLPRMTGRITSSPRRIGPGSSIFRAWD